MKFILSNDFYTDYEIIETESKQNAIDYIISEGKKTEGIIILGSSDNILYEELPKDAEILWVSEYF